MSCAFHIVEPPDLDTIWPMAGALLQHAVDMDAANASIESLHLLCRSGQLDLCIIHDEGYRIVGAMLFVITTTIEGELCCSVTHLAGDQFADWGKPLMPLFEQTMKNRGVKLIKFVGRLGFVRWFADQGYDNKRGYYVAVKSL